MLSEASYHNMTVGRIPSVEGGIQPTIVDAKGDLIAAVAADSLNRLAVGSNDQVLVADSATSTGLAWKSYAAQFVAGKNKIINGDFRINQRSFSSTTANNTYTFDRWVTVSPNTSQTFTSQTFTPGTAPVSGYESATFLQCATTAAAGAYALILQKIEDVRTFAGQTVTVSFWAKAASGTPKVGTQLTQNFGSGGSSSVGTTAIGFTLSTSWTRYSTTFSVPSIAGKTIGTGSFVEASIIFQNDYEPAIGQQTATIGVWGMQVENGSVATPFTTATGTIQGELAACQRYYYATDATIIWLGNIQTSINYYNMNNLPVSMRIAPTVTTTDVSNNSFAAGAPSTTSIGKTTFWAFKASTATTGSGNFQYTFTASAEL